MRVGFRLFAAVGLVIVISASCTLATSRGRDSGERPNILWLTIEDTSAYEFSCYGQAIARTPNVDRLAAEGVRYTRAWSTGSQCSPARSTLITGSYATTYGMDIHRRNYKTPSEIFYPQFLRQAGYHCTNNSKTDYNTAENKKAIWDECSGSASYNSTKRKIGQPFFAVFNTGVTHMGRVRSIHLEGRRDFAREGLDPDTLVLPEHVPDLPEIRSDFAFHLEGVQDIDRWVGFFRDDLAQRGLAEDTIIFFYSDHGGCLPRGKGFLYESGLHVPLIIYAPPKWQHLLPATPGSTDDRLVGFVDLAPTVLSLAGIKPPKHMQGQAFLGRHAVAPRAYQFGLRGNQASHYDPWRTVTDGRFSYVRTYLPEIPACVRNFYQWGMPANLAWDEVILSGPGRIPEAWRIPYQPKAIEQLYDLTDDPAQVRNLADDRNYATKLAELRSVLESHLRRTHDLGFFPPNMRDKAKPLYDWVRDTGFPLDRLITAAERAGLGDVTLVDVCLSDLRSSHAALRYWACAGFVTLGSQGLLRNCPDELLAAVNDSEKEVADKAAEAVTYLGRHDVGLSALMAGLEKDRGSAYSALEAMTWHPDMAAHLQPFIPRLRQLGLKNGKSASNGKAQQARSLLINLGELSIDLLYTDKDKEAGRKVNKDRRALKPRP